MMYARIANGLVAELFTPPADITLAECFTADIAAQFVTVPTDVSPAQGWSYSGGTFAAPAVVPPTLAQQAVAGLAAGLTLTLSGTMTLAATLFPTDATTQGKLADMAAMAARGVLPLGATSYPMKDSSGAWHQFNAAQYQAVAGAIAAYAAALILIADGNPLGATALPSASVSLTV